MVNGQILFKQTKTLINFLHNIIFVDFNFFNKNGLKHCGIAIVAEDGTEGEEDIAVIGVITGLQQEPVDLKEYSVITAIGMTKSLKRSQQIVH
jgi:hypothetical protein